MKLIKQMLSSLKPSNFALEPAMLVLFIYAMLLFSRGVIAQMDIGTDNQYLATVVLQILTFVIPAALWYRLRGMKRFAHRDIGLRRGAYLRAMRFAPPRARHAVIIAASVFALIAGCLLLSINFSGTSSFEGNFSLYDTIFARKDGTTLGAIGLILAYALLPALCEELVFRGILCAEYERGGVICAFCMNMLWFAFLHFNPGKLLPYLFAGAVLTALLYATRSVFATAIAHFAYNLFCIFGQQYITEFYITAGSLGIFIFIMLAILILSAAIFCGQAAGLYRRYAEKDAPSDYHRPRTGKEIGAAFASVLATPATVLCLLTWIVAVIVLAFI